MSKRFSHGLVIGKFYPPHLGHHHLISTAAEQCAEVTVLVMVASAESMRCALRVQWLRAVHAEQRNVRVAGVPSDAPVDYTDDVVWIAQVALMRTAVKQLSEVPVDSVFSSELYGDELAARLHAEHVLVDHERRKVPISSTALREDIAMHWHQLAPATRAGLTVRVVVLGAESTGSTTVARLLTDHYRARGGLWARTQCVSEYGREFTQAKWSRATEDARASGRPEPQLDALIWTTEEFDEIAMEQTRREEAVAAAGSPLLLCDTDAFATCVWERRYIAGTVREDQPWANDLLPRRDAYLLTSHEDVPWVDDGLREGDPHVRHAMTEWFAEALTRAGHSWVLLTGDVEQRLQLARQVTDGLLAAQLSFAPSITQTSAGTSQDASWP